ADCVDPERKDRLKPNRSRPQRGRSQEDDGRLLRRPCHRRDQRRLTLSLTSNGNACPERNCVTVFLSSLILHPSSFILKCGFSMIPKTLPNGSRTVATRIPSP